MLNFNNLFNDMWEEMDRFEQSMFQQFGFTTDEFSEFNTMEQMYLNAQNPVIETEIIVVESPAPRANTQTTNPTKPVEQPKTTEQPTPMKKIPYEGPDIQ